MQEGLVNAPVVREDGVHGRVIATAASEDGSPIVVVRFEDDAEIAVAPQMLIRQPDGSYRLVLAASPLREDDDVVIPVVAEAVRVGTRQIVRGRVRVHTRVETHEELVDVPIETEEVVVERLPVNLLVEGEAPMMREENGVVIIPVLEEVLVVEKRLMLREEVHVSKRVNQSSAPEMVALRQEVVTIERIANDGPAPAA